MLDVARCQFVIAILLAGLPGCSESVAVEVDQGKSKAVKNYHVAFSYDEIPGLEQNQGITRRDPSDVILHNGRYYLWYTKTSHSYSGYNASVWYAVSDDSKTWQEVGEALPRGKTGAWDSYSVFTPNILKANNHFYLFYTGVKPTPGNPDNVFENNSVNDETAIGVAVSVSPDGPFIRASDEPVLTTDGHADSFDSYRVDDAALIYRDGRYWLYYKGRSRKYGKDGPKYTRMGVAFSEQPQGPYLKYKNNPLTNGGHEVMVWPYQDGVMTLLSTHGKEGKSLQFAKDGLNFEIVGRFGDDYPKAPGAFRGDDFAAPPLRDGLDWGISMQYGTADTWPYLLRFSVDITGEDGGHNDTRAVAGNSFGEDIAFLEKHVETIALGDKPSGPRIAVVPAWQGRVMTSSATGEPGMSFGWLNYKLITRGIVAEEQRQGLEKHIHVFGGEDRFWIGPEGGQYAWYFKPGSPFEFDYWQVPPFIDTLPWQIVEQDAYRVRLRHREILQNWSGVMFDMTIEREVALLADAPATEALGIVPGNNIDMVAYESRNQLFNSGNTAWNENTGLPSIWILGMMKHGEATTVVIPFRNATPDGHEPGPIVKDDYFGKVPADRLRVDERGGVLYFSADGRYRSKIGISPDRSRGLAGSWDAARNVLTLIQYNLPPPDSIYVNSSWQIQDDPYKGDAINSYNDGPVDGGILGPFFEIETSSPALALAPGESYLHVHRTFHFTGDLSELDSISRSILNVSLREIAGAFERTAEIQSG